jgi:hypothetical protein
LTVWSVEIERHRAFQVSTVSCCSQTFEAFQGFDPGCPKLFLAPKKVIAQRGWTAFSNSSVELVLLPVMPHLEQVGLQVVSRHQSLLDHALCVSLP